MTKKVVTNDGKKGGWLVGKRHYDKTGKSLGGIKAVVTDAGGKPVELEGGEVIINREASKKYWKELSQINQSAGNGVAIAPPSDAFDEDPSEDYENGGKIEFNANHIPNKWILNYAIKIKEEHPDVWDLGGNIFGNQAFINLKRVAERGHWLDSEEWMYKKWRSFVARHKGDFRIQGVIAMLKWVDKVDKGWQYMKNLIEEEIKKREARKSKKMNDGGNVNNNTLKVSTYILEKHPKKGDVLQGGKFQGYEIVEIKKITKDDKITYKLWLKNDIKRRIVTYKPQIKKVSDFIKVEKGYAKGFRYETWNPEPIGGKMNDGGNVITKNIAQMQIITYTSKDFTQDLNLYDSLISKNSEMSEKAKISKELILSRLPFTTWYLGLKKGQNTFEFLGNTYEVFSESKKMAASSYTQRNFQETRWGIKTIKNSNENTHLNKYGIIIDEKSDLISETKDSLIKNINFQFERLISRKQLDVIMPDDKMRNGGNLSKTPAPASERIKGSKTNAKGTAKDSKSGASIKFDDNTISSIQSLISAHNEKYPSKKITLGVAKAVVRRGMGAYSSSHRTTITGGKPNSRTAWGLARLKAFIYKAEKGNSKSGKYSQDNDLFDDLDISVQKMNDGGLIATNGKQSNTTFDSSNPDIRYANGGGIETPISLQKPYMKDDKFQEDIAKENISKILNNVSFRKFGNEFRKHIMPSFTQEFNADRLTANYRWSEYASYIIGDGSYYVTEDEYNNFIKAFNTSYENQFDNGGDVRGMSWYSDFKKQQLKKGTEHELEHSDTIEKFKKQGVSDRQVASQIAKDHLEEDENYYIELDKMEGKKFQTGGLVTTSGGEANIGDTGTLETRKGRIDIKITNITDKWVIFNDLTDGEKRKDTPRDKFIENYRGSAGLSSSVQSQKVASIAQPSQPSIQEWRTKTEDELRSDGTLDTKDSYLGIGIDKLRILLGKTLTELVASPVIKDELDKGVRNITPSLKGWAVNAELFTNKPLPTTQSTIVHELENYRIKTEQEFINQYGADWQKQVGWVGKTYFMDWLFGEKITDIVTSARYDAVLQDIKNGRNFVSDFSTKPISDNVWSIKSSMYMFDPVLYSENAATNLGQTKPVLSDESLQELFKDVKAIDKEREQLEATPQKNETQINDELKALEDEYNDLLFLIDMTPSTDVDNMLSLKLQAKQLKDKIDLLHLNLKKKIDGELKLLDNLFNASAVKPQERYKFNAYSDGFAPDGQPTSLPKNLYDWTMTQEFQNWFGNFTNAYNYRNSSYENVPCSVVVNKHYEPLVVYHGTGAEFSFFKFDKFPAMYFAENETYSNWFAEMKGQQSGTNGYVYPFFLNIRTPLDLTIYGINPVSPDEFVDWMFLQTGLDAEELKISKALLDPSKKFQAWMYLRNSPEMLNVLRDKAVCDGIIYYEDNPSVDKSSDAYKTKAYIVFNSNSAKIADPNREIMTIPAMRSFYLKRGGKL